MVELPWAAGCCPYVKKLRTMLPLTVGIRDGAVQLVSILGGVVSSARAELGGGARGVPPAAVAAAPLKWVLAPTTAGVIAELLSASAQQAGGNPGAESVRAQLGREEGNRRCADCGAGEPDWAVINRGLVLCQHCAGAHRSLGTHISKVRSNAKNEGGTERGANGGQRITAGQQVDARTSTPGPCLARGGVWAGWACRVLTPSVSPAVETQLTPAASRPSSTMGTRADG